MKFPNQKVIGDHVSFTHVVICDYGPCPSGSSRRERVVREVEVSERRHAVITGVRLLYEGFIHSGSYDEPNHFEPTKGTWVYTARRGMSNAEIYLPTSGPNIPKLACCGPKCIPFRHQDVVPWTLSDDEKAFLREKAAQQPRVRGRFVKR